MVYLKIFHCYYSFFDGYLITVVCLDSSICVIYLPECEGEGGSASFYVLTVRDHESVTVSDATFGC